MITKLHEMNLSIRQMAVYLCAQSTLNETQALSNQTE